MWIKIHICPSRCSLQKAIESSPPFFFFFLVIFLGPSSFILQTFSFKILRAWVSAFFLTCMSILWVLLGGSTKAFSFFRMRWSREQRKYLPSMVLLLIGKIRTKIYWCLVRSFSQQSCEVLHCHHFRERKSKSQSDFLSCPSCTASGEWPNSLIQTFRGVPRAFYFHVCLSPVACEFLLGQGSCLIHLLHKMTFSKDILNQTVSLSVWLGLREQILEDHLL